ncbi:MAG: hypothetical protein IPN79_14700 [Saprospiraceae bacterium]|nr:hypothetical protein [Saprospiraceae bacterium]
MSLTCKIIKSSLLFFICVVNISLSEAQNLINSNSDAKRISPTEFSIPASPVFDLMGVTPSQVVRSSDIKDFKVDWAFKSWSLSPNIALQSQPFWEILYNRRDIKKYQEAPLWKRRLSSLDVSAGTVLDQNSDRRIGFAAKISLYKEKDPLMLKDYYKDIEKVIQEEKISIENEIKILKKHLDTISDIFAKPGLRSQIESLEVELLSFNSKRQSMINERASIIVAENWNSSWVDMGFGKINSYITDPSGSLKSLRINRSTATGLWINAGKGLGKSFLLSGLLRWHTYSEQVNFSVLDVSESFRSDTSTTASNNLFMLGTNLRYGSPFFAFFIECVYERRALKTPFEAIAEVFITPDNFEIVPESVNWTVVHPFRFNFGGDWRINKNLSLNFSMQTIFDKTLKIKTFLPVVSISCMMR